MATTREFREEALKLADTCSGLKTETLGLEKSPVFRLTLSENTPPLGLTLSDNGLTFVENSSKKPKWTHNN